MSPWEAGCIPPSSSESANRGISPRANLPRVSDKKDAPLDPDRAYIETPCEVARELLDPHEAGWLCESCERDVIDLSALTRVEAAEFLAQTADQDLCIGYRENDKDKGGIEFAPARKLVPVSRLLRGVGGGALALALAACDGGADAKPDPAPAPTETKAAVEAPEAEAAPTPKGETPEPADAAAATGEPAAAGTEETGGAKAEDTDGAAAAGEQADPAAATDEPTTKKKKKPRERQPKVGKRAMKKFPPAD